MYWLVYLECKQENAIIWLSEVAWLGFDFYNTMSW